MSEKVAIFGKKYTKHDLRKIVKEDNDPILEHVGGRLEYICDCSSVRFFEEYGETFRNKETGEEVEICMRYYPDDGSYEFAREQESVYYKKKKKMKYKVLWEAQVSGEYEVEAEDENSAKMCAISNIMDEMNLSGYKFDLTSCEAYEED